jgi:hypothetical protein
LLAQKITALYLRHFIIDTTLAACRTNHELAANSSLWPIFQLLFDQ